MWSYAFKYFIPAAIVNSPSHESNLFLGFASSELLVSALGRFILRLPGGGDQGDDEAGQGSGQDIRGVMAVICESRERGDRGHDDQPQL